MRTNQPSLTPSLILLALFAAAAVFALSATDRLCQRQREAADRLSQNHKLQMYYADESGIIRRRANP